MKFDVKDFIEQAKSEDGNIDYEKINEKVNEQFNKQANDLIVKKQKEAEKNAVNSFLKEHNLESSDDLDNLMKTKKEYEETQKNLEEYKTQVDSLSSEKEKMERKTKLLQKGYGLNDPDELDFVELKVNKRLKQDEDTDFDTVLESISEDYPPQKLAKYSTPRNKGSETEKKESEFGDGLKEKYGKK